MAKGYTREATEKRLEEEIAECNEKVLDNLVMGEVVKTSD